MLSLSLKQSIVLLLLSFKSYRKTLYSEVCCIFISLLQPLLVKHFEYSELQSIQQLVIVKHCALTNNVIYETLHTGLYSEDDELWVMEKQSGDGKRMAYYECIRNELNSAVSQHAVFEHLQSVMGNSIYTGHGSPDEETASVVMTQDCTGGPTFMDIPDLAVTKIFSYLDPPDLGRCAQVCWEWNNLVYQPCLWRRVCPTQWAVGESCSIKLCICLLHGENLWLTRNHPSSTDPYM